ncbi:MAG: hypothetical protein IJD20_00585 [Oscillospiraceae bacterium]|nr:hypothetical protein [Oscillospiraceae bacterium]
MRKTRRQLERELLKAREEAKTLGRKCDEFRQRLKKVYEAPEGCTPGGWCRVCAHKIDTPNLKVIASGFYEETPICGKGVCKGFEPKEGGAR